MSSIHAALRKRFSPPEWALFFEVRNAAGFDAKRSADAVAVNTWPSRGLEVQGIEVKVDRRDWLRELGQPDKSEAVQQYCDRWWVAVSSDDIVRDGELPPTWGLLVLRGEKLVQKVEAPKLEARPLTRTFVAALLRRATEGVVSTSEVQKLVEERLEQALSYERESHKRTVKNLMETCDSFETRIRDFEAASGLKLDSWVDGKELGKAVAFVRSGRGTMMRELAGAETRLANALRVVEGVRKELEGEAKLEEGREEQRAVGV